MKGTILLVDDERDIAKLIHTVLTKAGYKVHRSENADAAFAFLKKETADLMLLDIQLPGISGMKLLQMLREEPQTANLPVIMLTVLGDESHKVRGLEVGADDYLVKPFSDKELLARVEALLRRVHRTAEPQRVTEVGGISLDSDRQEVTADGKRIKLSSIEFQLLAILMKRKGFVLSYETLSGALSEGNKVMTSETLYVHVKNLRRSLGPLSKLIETVHGVGYKLVDS